MLIKFRLNDELDIIHNILIKGSYEKFFDICQGERWLDFGANIGAFSLRVLTKGGIVDAYECCRETFEILKFNLENNFNFGFNCFNKATVSKIKSKKKGEIYKSKLSSMHNSLFISKYSFCEPSEKVVLISVDDIEDNFDCLKMDIQGSEIDILLNNISFLKRFKKIIFEYHDYVKPHKYFSVERNLKKLFKNIKTVKFAKSFWEVYCWND